MKPGFGIDYVFILPLLSVYFFYYYCYYYEFSKLQIKNLHKIIAEARTAVFCKV